MSPFLSLLFPSLFGLHGSDVITRRKEKGEKDGDRLERARQASQGRKALQVCKRAKKSDDLKKATTHLVTDNRNSHLHHNIPKASDGDKVRVLPLMWVSPGEEA